MNAADDQTKISFHDASLVGIAYRDRIIFLSLEGVDVERVSTSMELAIYDAASIRRNGVLIEQIGMETDDGEIIRLLAEDGQVTLVVSWHKHGPKSHATCVYGFFGPDVRLETK